MAPPHLDHAQRSFGVFTALVHEPSTAGGRLQRGVELLARLVPGCDHAGVTLLTPAFVESVAATDDVVVRGDAWQHELSEGPGLDSVRGRTTVVSQDLRTDPRWRTWAPRVVDGLGVRSTMSVLLERHEDVVASLTLYADRPDVWDPGRQQLATALASQLAGASAEARMLDDRERALVSRVGLGQAQGIVMERFDLGADEAYDYLRRLSQSTQVGLLQLAGHIVRTRVVPPLPGRST
ncbi:GAF and ANTAR domain-containing protein [Microlunatus antarcticus]|uniref:GAF domain-containing protein n=1 Tax=Microlunatus antarcticus TaxID=53388 RepID=A0A7W5JRY2_9ACTN|nr:ANTAR domain-containing protein [Microlunatus antarcticus]MBB3325215.1 GAF domain-containing protein [Microlunatus antarcticus]